MTQAEFVQLVADMRTAQRAYFKTRTKNDLQTSKDLEKKVDAAVAELQNKTAKSFDTTLF